MKFTLPANIYTSKSEDESEERKERECESEYMLRRFTETVEDSAWVDLIKEEHYKCWLRKHPHITHYNTGRVCENSYETIINRHKPYHFSKTTSLSTAELRDSIIEDIRNEKIVESATIIEREIVKLLKENACPSEEEECKNEHPQYDFTKYGSSFLSKLVDRCISYKTGVLKDINDKSEYRWDNIYVFNIGDYASLPPNIRQFMEEIDCIGVVATLHMDKGRFLIVPNFEKVALYPPMIEYKYVQGDNIEEYDSYSYDMKTRISYDMKTRIEVSDDFGNSSISVSMDFKSNLAELMYMNEIYYRGLHHL